MNPAHQSLFEALTEAASSGGGLSPEWEERVGSDPKLRAAAARFERISEVLRELPPLSAPDELEGRVVGATQAGHREDRVAESLRGLLKQQAPPELEALVAESMPGVTHLDAPAELDQRVEALLRGWESEEEAQSDALNAPSRRSRLVLVGQVAAAASVLFLVVLATPRKSEHERARDDLVQSVEVLKGEVAVEPASSPEEGVLNELRKGQVELAAPNRRARKTPNTSVKPNRAIAPVGSQRRNAASSASTGGAQSSSTSGGGAAGRSGADLLTKLTDPRVPSHLAQRLVRIPAGTSSPLVLIYREQVAVTEEGTFSIEPLEVLQPQMAPTTEDNFQALQKSREAFIYRYQGFRIKDLELFNEQYTTVQSFNSAILCGLECVELEIEPNFDGGHSYHLWVEPVSGICLRTQESDESGHLVCEVEYENIEFAPELVSELSGGPSEWESIDAGPTASQVLTPLWIPEGYVLQGVEAYTDAQGGEWTRLRYTNGIEAMMVLQGSEQATAQAPTRGPATDALTQVNVHEVGAWTVVEGYASGQHIIVMGKRPEADLVATLASVIP